MLKTNTSKSVFKRFAKISPPILLILILCVSALAQQSQSEDENYIKPARPTISNPAEIQKAGVLQLEFGYDSNLRGSEFRWQQSVPVNLRFAANSRVLLEAEVDAVLSEKQEENGEIHTGIGDTRLGFQIVALKDSERHPALAFGYSVKIPTASEAKMLGTGRFDHRLKILLSKKISENTDLDFNAAYLNVGREDSDRRADGGLAAVALSHEFKNTSLDDEQPKGVYALGALTYKINKRLRFDTGLRFGLTNDAPRVGIFGGFTVGVGNVLKK
jgi:hypothetical protein